MVCYVRKNMAGEGARLRFGRHRASDGADLLARDVAPWQKSMKVEAFGGDSPTRYEVLEGFDTKPVAFGSDAPQLTNFTKRCLCGPGSILVAHTSREFVTLADLEQATANYVKMYEIINK